MSPFKQIFKNSMRFAIATGLSVAVVIPTYAKELPVLNQAPSDVDVIVIIPNIGELDKKATQMMASIGLPPMSPLQMIAAQSRKQGLLQAVNTDGSVMIAISGLADAIENQSEPGIAVYIPTNDSESLTELLQEDETSPPSIRNLGTHILVCENDEKLAAIKAGNQAKQILTKLGVQGKAALASNDISIILLNTDSNLLPALQKQMGMMGRMMENMPEEQKARMKDQAMGIDPAKIFKLYSQFFDRLLGDNTGIISGIKLDKKGIHFESNAAFKKDSPTGKFLKSGSSTKNLLNQTPAGNYLAAFTFDMTQINCAGLTESFTEAFSSDDPDAPINFGDIYKDILKPEFMAVKSAGAVYLSDDEQKPLYASITQEYKTSEIASRALNIQGTLFDKLKGLKANGKDIYKKMEFTKDAKTISDVTFNKMIIETNLTPEMQMFAPMVSKLGIFGQTWYVGQIGNKLISVASPTEPTDAQLKEVVASVNNTSGLDANTGINVVRKNLHKNPTAEFYLSPSSLVKIINIIAGPMMQIKIEMPNDVEPLGISYKISNHNINEKMYLSNDTIQQIIASSMAAQQQIQEKRREGRNNGAGNGPQ